MNVNLNAIAAKVFDGVYIGIGVVLVVALVRKFLPGVV